MKKINVYLAGYISGEKIKECIFWRNKIKIGCSQTFNFIDPMDAHSEPEKTIDVKGLKASDCSHNDVFYRDYNCVKNSDILVANMDTFGAISRPLTGTIFEIAWAYEWKIPIILIADDENYTEHPFTRMTSLAMLPTVEKTIEKLEQLKYTFGK